MTDNIPLSENILSNFSRQIIGLSVNYQGIKNGQASGENWLHFTGFIYSDGTKWYWVSAGHVFDELKKLKKLEDDGSLRINYYRLRDKVGTNQKCVIPIPFNFDINEAKYIFDEDFSEGIKEDVGFYELYYLVKEDLERSGIKPFMTIKEAGATVSSQNEFYLLGTPDKLIDTKGERTTFAPVIIPLGFIKEENENPIKPRLIFALPEGLELDKLKGMSGGPVIGFSPENKERYYLIGIQSGCDEKRNITIVCPTTHFVAFLQEKK